MIHTRFPLHKITDKDLPQVLQQIQVLIIDTEQQSSLPAALETLYAHQSLKIGYMPCTETALGAIIELCVEASVMAIVTGTSYVYSSGEAFSATLVSPSVTLENNSICSQLFNQTPLDLFSVIGYQLYLSDPQSLKKLHQRYFEALRLGSLRDKLDTAEPMLRESQQSYFDLNAVRCSDAPECTQHNPNGMYAEEMCQLARYVGMSDNVYYTNISGYNPHLPATSQSMQLVAQIIWHLIDGFSSRRKEEILFYEQNPDFKKIIVNMDNQQQLLFLNSKTSHRWWMKIPIKNDSFRWISCIYEDYQCACQQEVPARWLWFYQKLNSK